MTPKEVTLAYKGHRRTVEEQWYMHKWSLSHLISVQVKDFNPKLIKTPLELAEDKGRVIDESELLKVTKRDG